MDLVPDDSAAHYKQLAESTNALFSDFPDKVVWIDARSERSWLWRSEYRKFSIQALLKRLVLQIYHGCPDESCLRPLCNLSSESDNMINSRPSLLTSRSMAYAILLSKNPEHKLCANAPSPQYSDLFLSTEHLRVIASGGPLFPAADTQVIANFDHNHQQQSRHFSSKILSSKLSTSEALHPNKVRLVVQSNQETKPLIDSYFIKERDRRSLTQSLFQSRRLLSFEWMLFPTPLQILLTAAKTISEIYPVRVLNTTSGIPAELQSPTFRPHPRPQNAFWLLDPKNSQVQILDAMLPMDTSLCHEQTTNTSNVAPGGPYLHRHTSLAPPRGWFDRTAGFDRMVQYIDRSLLFPEIIPTLPRLTISSMLKLKETILASTMKTNRLKGTAAIAADAQLIEFGKQSIQYNLGSSQGLANSFREPLLAEPLSFISRISAFQWGEQSCNVILDCFWQALEDLFLPPAELRAMRGSNAILQKLSAESDWMDMQFPPRSDSSQKHVNDADASHIIALSIIALVASTGYINDDCWSKVTTSSGSAELFNLQTYHRGQNLGSHLEILDRLQSESACRLARRLLCAIGARRAFSEILNKIHKSHFEHNPAGERQFQLMGLVIGKLAKFHDEQEASGIKVSNWSVTGVFVCWLKNIITAHWDGSAQIRRWGVSGCGIEILADFEAHWELLSLCEGFGELSAISSQLDMVETALGFLQWKPRDNFIHILQHPFLFPSAARVLYFRTINYSRMSEAYQQAECHNMLMERLCAHAETYHHDLLQNRLKKAFARFLVIDIRRDYLLEDTMDQLWARERRELFLPLKVRMGMDAGEAGVDQGGVSQEFFRVVFEQAFDPEAGLFITDPVSQMSWFQPGSLEPLQTYELLGSLMSLAVYNGFVLPLSLPLAFYARLLDRPVVSVNDIDDGWPTLSKALEKLLDWTGDSVESVFVRDYIFSFGANGHVYEVDMTTEDTVCPFPLAPDAFKSTNAVPPVTNANREAFVEDYISWLTDKSVRPQLEAFAHGLNACVDPKTLGLLDPETFRLIAEGHHDFDIAELENVTTYDQGYYADHPVIRDFWVVVREYSTAKQRALIEFVTASDRVPAQGMRGLAFSILRQGGDSERLPTSMTCFGKLLLPEYSSQEKLKSKLDIALENRKGFGSM